MTTLIELNVFPPGGYPYFEPSINWRNPDPYQDIKTAARLLQRVRAQNPAAGLDPSYEACLDAVRVFTCARLHGNPKFCMEVDGSGNYVLPPGSIPIKAKRCAGCG